MFKKMINDLKDKRKEKKLNELKKRLVDEENKRLSKMTQEEQMKYSAGSGDLVLILKHYKELESFGTDYADYNFYDTMDLDEKENVEPFEGLMIKLNWPGEGITYVSYEELLEIIMKNKEMYLVFNPDKKEIVEQYIEEYKKKTNLK